MLVKFIIILLIFYASIILGQHVSDDLESEIEKVQEEITAKPFVAAQEVTAKRFVAAQEEVTAKPFVAAQEEVIIKPLAVKQEEVTAKPFVAAQEVTAKRFVAAQEEVTAKPFVAAQEVTAIPFVAAQEEVTIKPLDIENAIQKVETLALTAQQVSKLDTVSSKDTEQFYDHMIEAIDEIAKAIKYSDNLFKFIEAKGVLRILSSNLTNKHSKLRTKLLLLLKELFDVAPISTDAMLLLNLIDRVLDIFENDNNLALKAHAVDILYKWLPNNPGAQVRVMKLKGLETFYNQMEKLDAGVIHTLIELLNKIIKEHADARNNKTHVTEDVGEMLTTYQRIGLLERMSSPVICNGLLNILQTLWSYNNNENDYIKTVLELIKNVQPFCSKTLVKKSRAIKMFKALLEYLKDEDRKEYFEKHDVNVTDFENVLEEYLKKVYPLVKDEF